MVSFQFNSSHCIFLTRYSVFFLKRCLLWIHIKKIMTFLFFFFYFARVELFTVFIHDRNIFYSMNRHERFKEHFFKVCNRVRREKEVFCHVSSDTAEVQELFFK